MYHAIANTMDNTIVEYDLQHIENHMGETMDYPIEVYYDKNNRLKIL